MSEQTIDDGGPAFPVDLSYEKDGIHYRLTSDGMTLRQYAAIKLGVPDSGADWLDEMIVKARRTHIAIEAMKMHGAALSDWAAGSEDAWHAEVSRLAYATANAMLKACAGGAA